MLDFNHHRTQGLAMSSVLFLPLMLAVACAPDDSGEELLPEDLRPPPGTYDRAPPALVGKLRSVGEWEELFLNIWGSSHTSDYLPMSTSDDSWEFYNLAYAIDGNTAMYRATGKTPYLDRALLYVNNMVGSADPSSTLRSNFNDAYRGWKTQLPKSAGEEVPLFESYCWRYVTRLLRVIRETPALYTNTRYRSQYDRLLAFSELHIFEKWYRRGADAYIYRDRTHMAAHWAAIAMDLSLMTSDPTRKATYLSVFNNINRHMPNTASSLRDQLRTSRVNPEAYFWSHVWGEEARPGQDVAHGNGVMAFIVEAHDAKMEWTEDDIRRFTATFDSVIWPKSGKYSDYVDGSGTGIGWFTDGFMKLGRYDAYLQYRLESHSVGQSTQFFGNGALNMRLLSERSQR
ncbi:hypothetical protein [Hyalangium rubrum]|uniref:Uncharacterized protein n=1 Tax=Hyalangium rubrum TaxID=3103134 RepID=A0ABU5HB52_9BACT|nr:hypothetical protein [Hyalangium sp. s54d21]MDY7230491.1 hypothetical protein [Hyalangium sp. s54d21]